MYTKITSLKRGLGQAPKKMFKMELSGKLYKVVIFVLSCYALLYEKTMKCFGQKREKCKKQPLI